MIVISRNGKDVFFRKSLKEFRVLDCLASNGKLFQRCIVGLSAVCDCGTS